MQSKIILTALIFSYLVEAKETFVVPQSLLNQVEQGNAEAAYFIAQSFLDGNDDYQKDHEKAMTWLEKSADMGYAHAMNTLADELHQDDQKQNALGWYHKAADAGIADAFGAIASYHLMGEAGLEKDCKYAYQWFEKAETREVRLAYNNHAWNLATASDSDCRNPEKALVVYSRVKSLYNSSDESIPWNFWDTEAAILAAISDFSGAIKLQKWLIEEMSSYDINIDVYQAHLDRYLQRKPWIEVQ